MKATISVIQGDFGSISTAQRASGTSLLRKVKRITTGYRIIIPTPASYRIVKRLSFQYKYSFCTLNNSFGPLKRGVHPVKCPVCPLKHPVEQNKYSFSPAKCPVSPAKHLVEQKNYSFSPAKCPVCPLKQPVEQKNYSFSPLKYPFSPLKYPKTNVYCPFSLLKRLTRASGYLNPSDTGMSDEPTLHADKRNVLFRLAGTSLFIRVPP